MASRSRLHLQQHSLGRLGARYDDDSLAVNSIRCARNSFGYEDSAGSRPELPARGCGSTRARLCRITARCSADAVLAAQRSCEPRHSSRHTVVVGSDRHSSPGGAVALAARSTQLEKLKFLGDHAAISNSIRLAGQIWCCGGGRPGIAAALAGAGVGGAPPATLAARRAFLPWLRVRPGSGVRDQIVPKKPMRPPSPSAMEARAVIAVRVCARSSKRSDGSSLSGATKDASPSYPLTLVTGAQTPPTPS